MIFSRFAHGVGINNVQYVFFVAGILAIKCYMAELLNIILHE